MRVIRASSFVMALILASAMFSWAQDRSDDRLRKCEVEIAGLRVEVRNMQKQLDRIEKKQDEILEITSRNTVDVAKINARTGIIGVLAGLSGSGMALGGRWAIVRVNGKNNKKNNGG